MKNLNAALSALALVAVACGSTGGGTTDGGSTTTDGGSTVDAGKVDAGLITDGVTFGTRAQILAFLDGKTLTMEGSNIPPYPNGFNANVNFGPATQCYKNTVLTTSNEVITANSQLGVIVGADGGTVATNMAGVCTTTGTTFPYVNTSTNVGIENIKNNGECFDFTVTYMTGPITQEGRGSIGNGVMKLELYFATQAANHRCANGNPGAAGVTVNTLPLGGNSVQTYVITK